MGREHHSDFAFNIGVFVCNSERKWNDGKDGVSRMNNKKVGSTAKIIVSMLAKNGTV